VRRKSKLSGPPTDQGNWDWHTIMLKLSLAWRGRSSRLIQLIEFLEVENLRHAGLENGRLLAPFAQLEAWGMRRETLKQTIREGVERKLIAITGGGTDIETGKRLPHLYRLTYSPTIGTPPTDEWKQYRAHQSAKDPKRIEQAKRAAAVRWGTKTAPKEKQKPGTETGTKSVPKPASGESEKASISAKSLVPKSVPTPGTETGTTLVYLGRVRLPDTTWREIEATTKRTLTIRRKPHHLTKIGARGGKNLSRFRRKILINNQQ
jgi:hypothetical protein